MRLPPGHEETVNPRRRRMTSPQAHGGGSTATLLALLLSLAAFSIAVYQPSAQEAPNRARLALPSSGVSREDGTAQYRGADKADAIAASTRLPAHSAAGIPEEGRGVAGERRKIDRLAKEMGVQRTPTAAAAAAAAAAAPAAAAAALLPGGNVWDSDGPSASSTARRATKDDSAGVLSVEGAAAASSTNNRQVAQQVFSADPTQTAVLPFCISCTS